MADQEKAGCYQANCRTCNWKSWTYSDADSAAREAARHQLPNPGHIIDIWSVRC